MGATVAPEGVGQSFPVERNELREKKDHLGTWNHTFFYLSIGFDRE